jgi:hypothetical protein
MRVNGALSRARPLITFPGLLLMTLAAGGCGPRPTAVGPANEVRPRSTAVLTILSPQPGVVISGPMLHVRLRLQDAQVTPQISTHLRPDRGHIHLLIDGRVVSMAYGLDQDIPVTKGAHLLTAEFVAQDHFPFDPRVIRSVTFTAR